MPDQRIFAITDVDSRPLIFTASKTLATETLRTAEADEELFVESHARPADAEEVIWAVLDSGGRVIGLRSRENEAREDRERSEAAGEEASVMAYPLFHDTAAPQAEAHG